MSENTPLYTSEPTVRSLGQTYYLYSDRIEFKTHLGAWDVPFSEIINLEIRPMFAMLDIIRGRYTVDQVLPSIKLDLADLEKHLSLDRNNGFWKQIRFTPDDPEAFLKAYNLARNENPGSI